LVAVARAAAACVAFNNKSVHPPVSLLLWLIPYLPVRVRLSDKQRLLLMMS